MFGSSPADAIAGHLRVSVGRSAGSVPKWCGGRCGGEEPRLSSGPDCTNPRTGSFRIHILAAYVHRVWLALAE